MKKLIFTLLIATVGAIAANAQDSVADSLQNELDLIAANEAQQKLDKKIWGKGRFMRLGYSISETTDEFGPVEKSKYSFALTKGTSYRLHKKAIAGMIKFSIDAVWFDAQFTKFKAPYSDVDWTSTFEPIEDNGYDEDDDEPFDLNIGRMALSFGMGVGPNISVAPFALTSIKILQPLRASLYFHYSPTVMLYAKSQDGDFELSTAFCNMMNFGGYLTYRKISLGVEGRWGKGKFKPLDFESMFDGDGTSMGSQKYTRKFANTRIYLQFAF